MTDKFRDKKFRFEQLVVCCIQKKHVFFNCICKKEQLDNFIDKSQAKTNDNKKIVPGSIDGLWVVTGVTGLC